ncbi:DNA-binding FadR family transcriptional regulator [Diaminobutyricimonas aerilata]|uniref:DNA-binding FadR family transcriptional regulator n=1 Tax=Diaminobutyricimonas aerilata TaxID=1162967 RepID=A0A2M9CG02_9MICO|nr:FCD domain-containing protein [Diaminobutyricimonas aerilata]PJJ70843.1 DNA-binding FadR family transcriptional regulator [Diaminobutyricimonas aerilata]
MSAMNTALDGLRQMISSGELSPGQRFPPEAELCSRLKVSRSSLREAVRILDTLGAIDVRHGSGTYVSRLDPADIVRGFSITVDLLPLEGLLQLFEVRRVLEGHAAGQAAARAPEGLVEQLRELAARMEATDDPDEVSRLDYEFHQSICAAAGNPTITSLMSVFRARGRRYRILRGGEGDPVKHASDAGHRAIVDAIERQDPAAASVAASAHVAQTAHWLGVLHPHPEP